MFAPLILCYNHTVMILSYIYEGGFTMKMFKRLTAMLVAVMMLLSMTSALAVELPVNRMQEALQAGKAIESTTTLNIDALTVGNLLGMMSPPPADEAAQEQQNAMLGLVLGAINKLKINAISNESDASGVLSTDQGTLIDFAVQVDQETGENVIASSLYPGVVLSNDPEMMKATMQQAKAMQQNPQAFAQMAAKYMETVNGTFEKEVAPSLKVEEGAFDVEGVKYTKNTTGVVTTKHLGSIMKAVTAVAKEDAELKAMLEPMMQNAAQQNPEGVKTYEDLMAQLDEGADTLLGLDKTALEVNAYENEEKASLAYLSTPYLDDQAFHATINTTPSENGTNKKIALVLKTRGEGDTAETPDWDKTKQDIAGGLDMSSVVVNADIANTKDEAANKSTSLVNVSLQMMGMPIIISVNSDETLSGAYESNATIAMSFLAPTPLLTITSKNAETDKQPTAPATEGTTALVIKGEMKEEDMAPLMQAVKEKGLPQLMENIGTALPEEAGVLVPLLQQMLTPPAMTEGTTQAN